MGRWAGKKSVTKAVLNPERTNEQKVFNAIQGKEYTEGDKVYLFSDIDGEVQQIVKEEKVFLKNGKPKMIPKKVLVLVEDFKGTYDFGHYLSRVWKTTDIMKNVLDMEKFPKYHLKGKRKLLEDL